MSFPCYVVPEVAADEVDGGLPESFVERDEEGGVDEGVHEGHVQRHLVRRRRLLRLVVGVTATGLEVGLGFKKPDIPVLNGKNLDGVWFSRN